MRIDAQTKGAMAIKIAKPSDAEAKQYPREYAIYTQIPGAMNGAVSSEVRPSSITHCARVDESQ